ncbi:MAG: 2-iminoacetate synthase ThiH [Deltaproteobacteria bacterium]|nr:2-iminoacetate synthase ThiH [Deltaproteobacteria bacterium]
MSFADKIKGYNWDTVKSAILAKTADDVRRALYTDIRTYNDLLALLSPAAEPFIEDMAQQAHRTTLRRFGKIIQMYAPLYVSNKCINSCLYCGFNRTNKIDRKTLTEKEVMQEAETIYNLGFRHILLVSGEAPKDVPVSYFCRIAQSLNNLFSSISIEIYPMDTEEYKSLIQSGVDGLTVYQETYNRTTYQQVHPAGKKSDYKWRLMTPDRGGTAGFRRLNIGTLLGLSDWRVEGAFTGLHAIYLMRQYWQSLVSISFPRLRPATGGYEPEYPVNDSALAQLICAFRLLLPDAGLVISTREPEQLRNNLMPLGITQMSAGSRTSPGGYSLEAHADNQFEISDIRSPEDVARMITSSGYEPVWKDWDKAFLEG